ncbi:MAG TPA: hypothetical protein VLK65_00730 [Vicinamibacteria bacterium]|nr:hypothetical protein [Vicinamibacteria bacterium]
MRNVLPATRPGRVFGGQTGCLPKQAQPPKTRRVSISSRQLPNLAVEALDPKLVSAWRVTRVGARIVNVRESADGGTKTLAAGDNRSPSPDLDVKDAAGVGCVDGDGESLAVASNGMDVVGPSPRSQPTTSGTSLAPPTPPGLRPPTQRADVPATPSTGT